MKVKNIQNLSVTYGLYKYTKQVNLALCLRAQLGV